MPNFADKDVQREIAHESRMRSRQPGDIPLGRPRSVGMRQQDRPLMEYDSRRAKREMARPVFGSRKMSRR